MRVANVVAAALLASVGSCASAKCALAPELETWAGVGAVDCGHVLVAGDRATTDACVASNLGSHPFFAIYEQRGTDSHVATAVARAPDGRVAVFFYDGDPSGGGGDARPMVTSTLCVAPVSMAPPAGAPAALPVTCGTTAGLDVGCQ